MIKHAIYVALAFCLAAIAVGSDAFALENIVRPYFSARSAGMGGLHLTTGLYDENFYGNPARATANPTWKISILDLTVETSPSTISHVGDLLGSGDKVAKIADSSGSNNHARVQTAFPAIYIPHLFGGKNSLAIGLLSNAQFDIDLRRSFQVDPKSILDVGPAITFARSFMADTLSVGITGHATYRLATREGYSLVDLIQGKSLGIGQSGRQGSGYDFDIGSTYDLPFHPVEDVTFGTSVAINNILGGKYSNLHFKPISSLSEGVTAQPRTLGLGVSARKPKWWKFDDVVFGLESTDIGNNTDGSFFRTLHLGGEIRYGILLPRVGINQGYFGAGLGIDLKHFVLDVATYGEEMSLNTGGLQDRRYVAKIALQI
ncbi:MAG: hypothetical protein H7222_09785 [Methylotenera sp.]|nr:hypothetical protein [Oligoflexia bacterium]